ncbi:hypothetical protein [Pseudoalteromonas sp. Xi13]|uniref:hypothetical protein n=1 Tax=Pseudoalteromonas sp. Xi13 TaxID=2490635 RepID=UPI000F7626FB|nr:hypothetical protein [Pseudoalteromonas sp. Xi13]AZN32684.1 hypothetical protein EJ103_08070 [Pseudoalteromonas sp. Xi13]
MSSEIALIMTSAAGIGAIASAIAAVFQSFRYRKENKQETLEDRINKLTSALKESSHLVTEVEQEIQSRRHLVVELEKDAEKYQNLVSMNKEQVEAVAQLLQGELRKEVDKSFWKGILANFVFFILGAGVSLGISLYGL